MLTVLKWPHPTLSAVAKDVTEITPDLVSFIDDMFETMDKSNGIGLAAPQVDRSERFFTVHIPFVSPEDMEEPLDDEIEVDEYEEEEQWWHNKDFVFINPVITKTKGKTKSREGCLSLPGVTEEISRHKEITCKFLDINGEEQEIEADGLFSICIQHELDHLDGRVFIQRLSRLKFQLMKKRIVKDREAEKANEPEDKQKTSPIFV